MEKPGTAADLVGLIAIALRRERARAGLSLTEVARQAGIAKSTLSQLESGAGNPSVETLWALAVALGVPFSQLVEPPGARVEVIRVGQGLVVYSEESDYHVSMLSSGPSGVRRDIYLVSGEPGTPRLAQPHQPGTVEHLVLSTGRVEIGPTGDPVELGPGDYIRYPGDVPHVFRALEPGTCGVMVSEYP
ncbi:MAG TPA: XRE family transcriptional regulator [Trebonia sp.]|nr:XRE family transcriptional regulator [Trebonia sp.]